MRVDVLTLFPSMFNGPITESIIKRAQEKELVSINLINIRDYANNKHNTVDDYPYGGGAGMVIQAPPVFEAVNANKQDYSKVIMMCPHGVPLNQKISQSLSKENHLIIICGHYEGIDQRVHEQLVDLELSIGDYVLTGGELPAMVLMDSVIRLIPGVLGQQESIQEESFYQGLLEYPHYTRPAEYKGLAVPDVLLSGNHEEIRKWRKRESLKRTLLNRPDLLDNLELDAEGKRMIAQIREEIKQ